jgi:hypothetical protein
LYNCLSIYHTYTYIIIYIYIYIYMTYRGFLQWWDPSHHGLKNAASRRVRRVPSSSPRSVAQISASASAAAEDSRPQATEICCQKSSWEKSPREGKWNLY